MGDMYDLFFEWSNEGRTVILEKLREKDVKLRAQSLNRIGILLTF